MRLKNTPWLALALATATLTSACAPLIIGGAAVGGALMYSDRRTTGTQIEDEGIEIKGSARAREAVPSAHVNVTSYNRMVLLTGEAPSEADKQAIARAVGSVENVRSLVNELEIAAPSALTARTSDTLLASQVKTRFLNAADLQANAIKVVCERGIIYLMGRVTEREATRAVELARTVGGVQKVVRVFELMSEDELKALSPPSSQPTAK